MKLLSKPKLSREKERELENETGLLRLRPNPDARAKPEKLQRLPKEARRYLLRKTWQEFSQDQCTTLAAALTYYAVLAIFPALLALVSLVALSSLKLDVIDVLFSLADQAGGQALVEAVRGPIEELSQSEAAGWTLFLGLLTALWSASAYTVNFGKMLNRIYEVEEGRNIVRLRLANWALTLTVVALLALMAFLLAAPDTLLVALTSSVSMDWLASPAWAVGKFSLAFSAMTFIVTFLYKITPNVRQPRLRWLTPGAAVALAVWVLASLGFALYVSTLGNYASTYGALGSIIVFLLWLWLTNIALLFGAELDAELERTRQLVAGLPAEENILLPLKEIKGVEKRRRKELALEEQASKLKNDRNVYEA